MSRDAEIVSSLLSLEQALVFAYRQLPGSWPMVTEFARQEAEHARKWDLAARELGAARPASGEEALAKLNLSKRPADIRGGNDLLDFLLEAEDVAVGTYFVALPKLRDPGLVRTSAQIMANEAQHVALLRERRLNGDPTKVLPTAFVEGKH